MALGLSLGRAVDTCGTWKTCSAEEEDELSEEGGWLVGGGSVAAGFRPGVVECCMPPLRRPVKLRVERWCCKVSVCEGKDCLWILMVFVSRKEGGRMWSSW